MRYSQKPKYSAADAAQISKARRMIKGLLGVSIVLLVQWIVIVAIVFRASVGQ